MTTTVLGALLIPLGALGGCGGPGPADDTGDSQTRAAANPRGQTDPCPGVGDRPVGVFTLSDAGGVLPDPGARLPSTRSAATAAPRWWPRSCWHDFDYAIAIDHNRVAGTPPNDHNRVAGTPPNDHNRVAGTPPNDQNRPRGYARGGGIWLHMDRRRYVGLRQRVQGGGAVSAAHARSGPASRGGDGGQGGPAGLSPLREASLRETPDSP